MLYPFRNRNESIPGLLEVNVHFEHYCQRYVVSATADEPRQHFHFSIDQVAGPPNAHAIIDSVYQHWMDAQQEQGLTQVAVLQRPRMEAGQDDAPLHYARDNLAVTRQNYGRWRAAAHYQPPPAPRPPLNLNRLPPMSRSFAVDAIQRRATRQAVLEEAGLTALPKNMSFERLIQIFPLSGPEKVAMDLLRSQLTVDQNMTLREAGWFEVKGGVTHTVYRIQAPYRSFNTTFLWAPTPLVENWSVMKWPSHMQYYGYPQFLSICLSQKAMPGLPSGDRLLTQKLAFELREEDALSIGNPDFARGHTDFVW